MSISHGGECSTMSSFGLWTSWGIFQTIRAVDTEYFHHTQYLQPHRLIIAQLHHDKCSTLYIQKGVLFDSISANSPLWWIPYYIYVSRCIHTIISHTLLVYHQSFTTNNPLELENCGFQVRRCSRSLARFIFFVTSNIKHTQTLYMWQNIGNLKYLRGSFSLATALCILYIYG